MLTVRQYCQLLAKEYEAHSEERTLDSIIERFQRNGRDIPKRLAPVIRKHIQKRFEKRKRGRQKGIQTPEQRAIDFCAYHLVRSLLDRGCNPTRAATAVGRKMHLTRQAVLGAYDRVAWPFSIRRETEAFREKIVGPKPAWYRPCKIK